MAPDSVQQRRPRALAEIGLNVITNPDLGTSSDEDVSRDKSIGDASDAQSIVGVSLGPEQLRLTSPTTPAVEKSRAIEDGGGFFGAGSLAAVEEAAESDDKLLQEQDTAISDPEVQTPPAGDRGRSAVISPTSRQRLPSPWRAEPRTFQSSNLTRSFLGDSFDLGRRRASSGAALSATWEHWQKALLSSLPNLPKGLTVPSPFSSNRGSTNHSKASSPARQEARRSTVFSPTNRSPLQSEFATRTRSQSDALALNASRQAENDHKDQSATQQDVASRPMPARGRSSYLRRSASDQSLHLHRVISRSSTLGDDSRFEHVSAQVNSRMKAIRDSFQDSNIRVPSIPSLPNFSLDSFKPDFSYDYRHGFQRKSFSTASDDQIRGASPRRSSVLSPTLSQTKKNAAKAGNPREGAMSAKIATAHPHFTKACADLTGDLVVLGGYRGSILRSADPPHRQLWVPVKVGLNIRKVDMEVGLNIPEDDAKMQSKIIPGGMLTHIGPVDISRRLFRRLRACDSVTSGRLRVHDYGYDWRLDPLYLSERLIKYLEGLPCNQFGTPKEKRGATVIAHSLGGLITRHAVNKRPDLFAGVVYAGTPHFCVNILGPLRNGDDVLLSSRVLTAQVNFSIRTSFALLPLDGKCFFNKETKEQFPVDFFDPQTWTDYRLSPCLARPLPSLEPAPAPGMLDSLMSSISSSLPSVGNKRGSFSLPSRSQNSSQISTATSNQSQNHAHNHTTDSKRTELEPSGMSHTPPSSIGTAVTISPAAAHAYLTTCLARIKQFKTELSFHDPHHKQNTYPPAAVIYGKSTPTVYGAKVKDREAIKHASAYDNLAFASGDGVVLARAAMLPDGYEVARGGVISSERGHITLLGDLEAVGRSVNAIIRARGRGVGLGVRSGP